MTIEGNQFEIERRVVLFKSTTTLPSGSPLGYNGNPNSVINGNSDGETLLYNSPIGTTYMQDSGVFWVKKVSQNIWEVLSGASLVEDRNVDIYSNFNPADFGTSNWHTRSLHELGRQVMYHRAQLLNKETAFGKNTAFNKNFGTDYSQVPHGNHAHPGYEPSFVKYSAFNKNFGVGYTQAARGNHAHSGVYEPAFGKNTAFNKPFGTTSGPVAYGNHTHPLAGFEKVYDSTLLSAQVMTFNYAFDFNYEYELILYSSCDSYSSNSPTFYFNSELSGVKHTYFVHSNHRGIESNAYHKGYAYLYPQISLPSQTVSYDTTFYNRLRLRGMFEGGYFYNWSYYMDVLAHPTDQSNIDIGGGHVRGTFDGAMSSMKIETVYTGSNQKMRVLLYRRKLW